MTHAGFLGGRGHRPGFAVIHRDRLFTQDMFARRDGRQRDRRMGEIRRGDHHGVHLILLHDLFVPGGSEGDASLLPRSFERGRVRVAQRDDPCFGTEGEPRQMILQGDAAAADDGDADGSHFVIERRVCRRSRQTQADPARAAPPVDLQDAQAHARTSLGTRARGPPFCCRRRLSPNQRRPATNAPLPAP